MANRCARKFSGQGSKKHLVHLSLQVVQKSMQRSRNTVQRHQNRAILKEKKELVQLQIQNAEVNEGSKCVTNIDRVTTRYAKKIELDQLCSMGVNGAKFQMLVLEKLLALSVL
jgi:uncharacterized protein (UPF0305 family)